MDVFVTWNIFVKSESGLQKLKRIEVCDRKTKAVFTFENHFKSLLTPDLCWF